MSQAGLVECLWTCRRCGQAKVRCEVRARLAGEDVVTFMNRAMRRCAAQHAARSPRCRAGKLDLYMPIGADGCAGTGGEPSPETLNQIRQELNRPVEDES